MFDIHSHYLQILEGLIIYSHLSIDIFVDAWCHAVQFALFLLPSDIAFHYKAQCSSILPTLAWS